MASRPLDLRFLFEGVATPPSPSQVSLNLAKASEARAKGSASLLGAATGAAAAGSKANLAQAQAGQAQAQTAQVAPNAEANRAFLESQSKTQEASRILRGIEFISNSYGDVKSLKQLETINTRASKLGIIPTETLPQTVQEARGLFETSKRFSLRNEQRVELAKLQFQQTGKERLAILKAQLEARQATDKAKLEQKLFKDRSRIEFATDVDLENIKARNRILLEQQKKPTVFNIQSRQDGGPVQQGQPFLVGEQGPELFVPNQDGDVVNNQQTQEITQPGQIQSPALQPVADSPQEDDVDSFFEQKIQQAEQDADSSRKFLEALSNSKNSNVDALTKGLGFQIPKEHVLADPKDPSKGLKPVKGSKADRLAIEAASKVMMLDIALKASKNVERLIFNKDGSLNRSNLFGAQVTQKIPLVGGFLSPEGRSLFVEMEFGIQAITRLETGAAMPPSEVENTRIRFSPKFDDPKEVILLKINMFRDMMSGALKLVRPDFIIDKKTGIRKKIGRLDITKFNVEYIKRAKADWTERFIKANPNASLQDAENFIKNNNKQFVPPGFSK